MVVRDHELQYGVATPADQDCRPTLLDALPTGHQGHQPDRDQDREEGELPARHLRKRELVDAGDLGERENRRAQGTKGNRRRVGQQGEHRRVEWRETDADQQRRRDRHGRTESSRPFQQRAKAKSNQEGLHPPIRRDGRHPMFHHVELPERTVN